MATAHERWLNNIMRYSDNDLLMISGIHHFLFCRRRWALVHIEQQWNENFFTASGRTFHQNAHEGLEREKRGSLIITRGLPVVTYELGFYGICDVVEFYQSDDGMTLPNEKGRWKACPVEYKRGRPKEGLEDIAQVILQAIALEEMLEFPVTEGAIYYGKNKHRQTFEITEEKKKEIREIAEEMHTYMKRAYTPNVKMTPKCKACSLNDVCLPKLQERKSVKAYFQKVDGELNYEETS